MNIGADQNSRLVVQPNESNRTVTLCVADASGGCASLVLDVNLVVSLIASLIHSLPAGVEIDYEALIADPVHECIRDAKRRNLSRSDLVHNLRNLSVGEVRLTKAIVYDPKP